MLNKASAVALLCSIAGPAVGLECSFGKDSFGYDSIFRSMTVSGDEGIISTRRGKERALDCIGADKTGSMLSCVFHFPDGKGAYIYALSPDRTFLIFTAYVENASAPATLHEAKCSE